MQDPILFILYINDHFDVVIDTKTILDANDIVLLIARHTAEELQESLQVELNEVTKRTHEKKLKQYYCSLHLHIKGNTGEKYTTVNAFASSPRCKCQIFQKVDKYKYLSI